MRPHSQFPPATAVRVSQRIDHRSHPIRADIEGVIEAWEDLPTGSWLVGGKDGKLWLKRLRIRKPNGEISLLVVDDATEVSAV